MQSPHQILGVAPNASMDEIKRAFKKLALVHHPDKGGDPEKFKEINAAYQTLTNPKTEDIHINRGPNFNQNFHFDLNDIFSQAGFNDIFQNAGFNFHKQHRNRTSRVTVMLTLEEVYYGCDKTISLRRANGTEKLINCHIPAGIESGQTIKYAGLGDDSVQGTPPGDLLVVVGIRPHSVYDRIPNTLDLIMEKKVNAFDAILGGKMNVPTIDNKSLEVSIPRGIQAGTKVKLTGMGLKSNNHNGDLYVVIGIDVPNNLTEEQYKRLDEIRKLS